jgi:hypothetical protein
MRKSKYFYSDAGILSDILWIFFIFGKLVGKLGNHFLSNCPKACCVKNIGGQKPLILNIYLPYWGDPRKIPLFLRVFLPNCPVYMKYSFCTRINT